MRKKILFIISNLESGGVSKSMVNLLNTIDRERFDVSLLICHPSGMLMSLLPNDITIITDNRISALSSRANGFIDLLKSGNIILAFGHIVRLFLSIFSKAWAGLLISKLMPKIEGEWDYIVDFNGQQQCYYMVDKLKAQKKFTFFHSDYAKWPYYYQIDKRYYPKVDGIFTISQHCVDSLKKFFPEVADKVDLIENISSIKIIDKLADGEAPEIDTSTLSFITIGHLSKLKGTDLAINAAKILKDNGIKFKWFFIGADSKDCDYPKMVDDADLQDSISFLGIKTNPYPYIKHADLFVHCSLFEGKSIALDEAKILCKPIVVTNFSTVNDQFTNRQNASICEMDSESIAQAIKELISNDELRSSYVQYLTNNRKDNSSEINKLYNYLN